MLLRNFPVPGTEEGSGFQNPPLLSMGRSTFVVMRKRLGITPEPSAYCFDLVPFTAIPICGSGQSLPPAIGRSPRHWKDLLRRTSLRDIPVLVPLRIVLPPAVPAGCGMITSLETSQGSCQCRNCIDLGGRQCSP